MSSSNPPQTPIQRDSSDELSVEVIYRDDDYAVINKPPGLLSVPGLVSPDNAFDQIASLYPNARIVHRLDMATSGLLVFALHYQAQKHLSKQFERRQVRKGYRALLQGLLMTNAGEIHSPLICDWPNRPKQKIDWLGGKPASTLFRLLVREPESNTSYVALTPLTGRSHQLRVHMLQLGHPIVGDSLYGNRQTRQPSRMYLHASELCFHTESGLELELSCPPSFAPPSAL